MLGLSTGLIYSNYSGGPLGPMNPNEVQDSTSHTCLAWYDFTDATTMYTNAGSTNVSSDNDLIYRISNKSSASGGDRLTTYLQQTTSSKRPVYKTGGQNSLTYANFDGTDMYIGGFRDDSETNVGNAGDNDTFSNQNNIQSDEIAVFCVSAGFLDVDDTSQSTRSRTLYRKMFDIIAYAPSTTDDIQLNGGYLTEQKLAIWEFEWDDPSGDDANIRLASGYGGDDGGGVQGKIDHSTGDFRIHTFLTRKDSFNGYLTLGDNLNNSTPAFTEDDGTDRYFYVTDYFWDNGTHDPADGDDYPFTVDFTNNSGHILASTENKFTIGARVTSSLSSSPTDWFGGKIYELIVMKGDMYTDDSYQSIVQYLINKYGNNGEGYVP